MKLRKIRVQKGDMKRTMQPFLSKSASKLSSLLSMRQGLNSSIVGCSAQAKRLMTTPKMTRLSRAETTISRFAKHRDIQMAITTRACKRANPKIAKTTPTA